MISVRKNKAIFFDIIALGILLGLVSCSAQSGGFVSTVPPSPPAALKFETVDKGLLVSWRPVSGALKYTLFWGPEKFKYRKFIETKSPAVIIQGIGNGQLNYFAVTSSSAHAESRFSDESPYIYDTHRQNAPVHMQRAIELADHGHSKEALAYASAAIKLESKNPDYYRERARILERLGLKKGAQKDLEIAEQLYMKKRISLKEPQTDRHEDN
ncbi:MAG: hypothetical protein ACP5VS_03735 [Desulfomonilaceae bacterium]